jgi:DNA-binding NarL/FixJ family response regulator
VVTIAWLGPTLKARGVLEAADVAGPVAVLTVDDHAPFREALHAVVDATSGFELVAEASSGEEALALAADCAPDLVLVDIHLPGIDGVEVTRRLRSAVRAPVVVLLSSDDDPCLERAPAECGAATFIYKARFGRDTLTSIWGRFGPPGADRAHPPH